MGEGGSTAGRSDKLELWEMDDRSSIILTLSDKPGILNKALNIMTANNLNMTAIQSRPPKLI
jgi:prephenate dehydratase